MHLGGDEPGGLRLGHVELRNEVLDRLIDIIVALHHVVEDFEADALHIALVVVLLLDELHLGLERGVLLVEVAAHVLLLLVFLLGVLEFLVLLVELLLFFLDLLFQLCQFQGLVLNDDLILFLLLSLTLEVLLDCLAAFKQLLVFMFLVFELLGQILVVLDDDLLLGEELLGFLGLLTVEAGLQTLGSDVILRLALRPELFTAQLSIILFLYQLVLATVKQIIGLLEYLDVDLHHLNLDLGFLNLSPESLFFSNGFLECAHALEPVLKSLALLVKILFLSLFAVNISLDQYLLLIMAALELLLALSVLHQVHGVVIVLEVGLGKLLGHVVQLGLQLHPGSRLLLVAPVELK